MLRAKFFYKFFKDKQHISHEIVKYSSNRKFALQDEITNKLIDINQKISENSKGLLEAQIVKVRSTFSKSNNFIEKIGKNFYDKKLDESIDWYQKELKKLYLQRRNLQIHLEKIKGIFWLNRIKRFLKIIIITLFLSLILFIFFSGFIIIIYLLPLILLIFLGYSLISKKY